MNKYACVVAMMAVGMLAACAMSPNHPSHAAAGATGDVIAPLSLVPAVARLDLARIHRRALLAGLISESAHAV